MSAPLTRLSLASFLAMTIAACAADPARPGATAKEVYARPPLQDDFLDRLVGSWRIARSARGKQIENTMDARWVLQHQFVQLHMIDVSTPPAYEANVLIGFDPAKKQYVAHWCDTFGAGYSAIGRGSRTGDRVEFRFDYDDGPFFNTFTWNPADRSWTFRGENGQPDGSRKPFMEDHATRR